MRKRWAQAQKVRGAWSVAIGLAGGLGYEKPAASHDIVAGGGQVFTSSGG
jgi:hypothetical protein